MMSVAMVSNVLFQGKCCFCDVLKCFLSMSW